MFHTVKKILKPQNTGICRYNVVPRIIKCVNSVPPPPPPDCMIQLDKSSAPIWLNIELQALHRFYTEVTSTGTPIILSNNGKGGQSEPLSLHWTCIIDGFKSLQGLVHDFGECLFTKNDFTWNSYRILTQSHPKLGKPFWKGKNNK